MSPLTARGKVILDRLPTPTLSALREALQRHEYHVFHFIGHSGFDEETDTGIVIFEDGKRQSHLVTGDRLGAILHDSKSLQLAFLNACSSGETSTAEPFRGIAQILLQQGIPAVIAMQSDITDEAAIILTHAFYQALADRCPVDAALAEARKAVLAEKENMEWGTPVLYMRATDGQIFISTKRFVSIKPWPRQLPL
jgi:CHAT domain-containing protein